MITLLIVGIILLVVAYNVPMPPPLGLLCRVLGMIAVIVAVIVIVLGLLGVSGGTIWLGWPHCPAGR